jgi:RNA polymerase II-associated protein 2
MASKPPLKSILKKKPSRPEPSSARVREERDRQTALFHANMIQYRKDLDTVILNSTETLMELPSFPTADPGNPSEGDATLFRSHLATFQPADYDGLIQERNIDGKCGYVLCPRPRQLQDTNAEFRILRVSNKEGGINIVPRESLEKWCSESCQRRAMYVKVQLSEEPAWMREVLESQIVLLDEVEKKRNTQSTDDDGVVLTEGLETVQLRDQVAQRKEGLKDLALERGDREDQTRVDISIKETYGPQIKVAPTAPTAPTAQEGDNTHLLVEGYLPKALDKIQKAIESEKDGDER